MSWAGDPEKKLILDILSSRCLQHIQAKIFNKVSQLVETARVKIWRQERAYVVHIEPGICGRR